MLFKQLACLHNACLIFSGPSLSISCGQTIFPFSKFMYFLEIICVGGTIVHGFDCKMLQHI